MTYTHVNNWLGRDNKVPAGWVIPVSKAIDYRYTPHQIRPDIYPHPHDGLPEHLRLPIEDAA
ncbi:MAG: YdaS family helix-turn-helix protein [Methylophilaceae bacterium]